jgi:hypothetical protein
MNRSVVITAALLFAGAAHAQRTSTVDGAKLLEFCSARQPVNCEAYVSGIADMIAEQKDKNRAACIPVSTPISSIRGAIVTYLHHHPEAAPLKAAGVAVIALHTAYPCEK